VLAFDELWYRRGQFALIGLVVTLVTYLVLMMNALGAGLLDQAGSGIKRLNADALVFQDNANLSLQQSELSQQTVDAIGPASGVQASARLGYVSVQPSKQSDKGPVAFIGFEPGTISEPKVISGRPLQSGERGKVLADARFLDQRGAKVGDSIEVVSRLRSYQFEIVGEVDGGGFFFQAPVWGSIDDWRDLRYGNVDPSAPAATLVMVKGIAGIDTSIARQVPGTQGASRSRTFNAIPGVGPQRNTANAIEGFGLVIGAMVVGVFFYVLTLQKVGQIGVLKAIGASSWFVFRQLTVQVLLVAVAGIVVALPLTWLTVQVLPGGVPLLLQQTGVMLSMALLLATSLVGVAFSGRKIASIDPLIALGQQQ
jgi:putative ABC transport system permease protein